MKKYQSILHLLLITIAVILVYSNIFPNEFVWDDNSFILDWKETRDFTNHIGDFFRGSIAEGHEGLYRPVRSLLYGISYSLWQTNPWGYHIQSIVLGILGSIGAYLLAKKLFKNKNIAFVSGLLFAVHPVHVEAITWITVNFDIAGVIMSVYGILSYIQWRETKNKLYFLSSLLLLSVAYLTNEITLVSVGIIGFYDLLILNGKNLEKLIVQTRTRRKTSIKQLPPFIKLSTPWLILFTPALIYCYIRFFYLNIGGREEWIYGKFYYTAIVMIPAIVMQLQEFVWPFPLNVNHTILEGYNALLYHEINLQNPPAKPTLSNLKVLLSLAIIFLLVYLFKRYWNKNYKILFLCMWHILAILPLMQIVPQTIIYGERYLYFASFATIPLLVYLANQGIDQLHFKSKKSLKFFCVIVITIFFGYTSYQRNFDWLNEKTLWESSLSNGPESPVALSNLAHYEYGKDNLEESFELLLRSYEINPYHVITVQNLAVAYTAREEYDKAIELHMRVYEIAPKYANNYRQLSVAYLKKKDYQNAFEWQGKYLETRPNDVVAQFEYARFFHTAFVLDKAEEEYLKAVKIDPSYIPTYLSLSELYLLLGKYSRGLELLETSPVSEDTQIQALIEKFRSEEKRVNEL